MIQINFQDAFHQYDANYNPITTWDSEKCNWIVNPEYEDAYYHNEIDWYGRDNDFPRGMTNKEYFNYLKQQDNGNQD